MIHTAPEISILIVDDEQRLCELLSQLLEFRGYHVTSANNGDQALEEVRKRSFHIVVADLMMPGMDGTALYDSIRKSHPETCCIFMSGKPQFLVEDVLKKYRNSPPPVEFIRKPFDIEELEGCIERLKKKWFAITL